jgi:hypothetical protein
VLEDVRAIQELEEIPIIVLTAGKGIYGPSPEKAEAMTPEDLDLSIARGRIWLELQEELAALSPDSDHRIIDDSGHAIPLESPAEIIRAIRDVVSDAPDPNQGGQAQY